jgi:2-polyprenyl-3-methyl-5-hydroxy-6-metoxy-1,4-benzoquinol methylase
MGGDGSRQGSRLRLRFRARARSETDTETGTETGISYAHAMGKAEWGADPEFFGPRHAHREGRITSRLERLVPGTGLHLECAAGVGSLSLSLAEKGHTVISADLSLRSLRVLATRAESAGIAERVSPVVADINNLPFASETFGSATSAETLEHIPGHQEAVTELARILAPNGWLVGTVPAGPEQWSDWDDWAGHLRRYSAAEMRGILVGAGLEPEVDVWGWPLLRLYDEFFLKRVNRRRLHHNGDLDNHSTLSTVSALGRRRRLVALVRSLFALDRLFDGAPWGVGLLFSARKR